MKTEKISIKKIKKNPQNPRLIKDHKFYKLVESIKNFPEMLKIRPIVVNEKMVVLGGNMRLRACQEAKLKEVYIIQASELNEKQQEEFIIKDNVAFGEWDWDMVANEWDAKKLNEWALDVPYFNEKLEKPYEDEPEITITEEILEEHNYLVFTFDNSLDWQVVKEIFDIQTVAKPGFTETYMQKGVGRVKNGKELLEKLN